MDAREAKLRSDWVKVMEARLVREELAKCWREEGVNHYQSCHALSEKYIDMIRTHRVGRVSSSSEGNGNGGGLMRVRHCAGHWIQEARLHVLGPFNRTVDPFSLHNFLLSVPLSPPSRVSNVPPAHPPHGGE